MKEELSRTQYRLALICVKYSPWLIALFYFIACILGCFGITSFWITYVCFLPVIPTICLIAFSVLFKFCIWHRLPIYYAILLNTINVIDVYFTIPVSNIIMISIYIILTGIFILIGAYFKNKHNEKVRTVKKLL